MKFLVNLNSLNPDEVRKRFDEYWQYLKSIQLYLPVSVYEFATAPGHYDDGLLGLHDAWIQRVSISELAPEENHSPRPVQIGIRLLAAYHNREIELIYEGVRSYSLNLPPDASRPSLYQSGHGDWLIDEIRLSERNLVIHEIEFSRGSRWMIECENIRQLSISKDSTND